MIKVSFGAKSLNQMSTNDHNKSKSQKAKDQQRMNKKLTSILNDASDVIRRQIEEDKKKKSLEAQSEVSDEKKDKTN